MELGPVATQEVVRRLYSATTKLEPDGRPIRKAVFPSVEEAPTSHVLLPEGMALTFTLEKGAPPVAVQLAAAPVLFARNTTKEVEGCVVTEVTSRERRKSARFIRFVGGPFVFFFFFIYLA